MPSWLKDAVFYEIYPQSFYDGNGDGIGDLAGITEKLDYVKGLGCDAIWLNPCFVSPFKDAGYDVADYKTVAPRYGTNEDLYRLFETAHQKGIHILLDLVPGHTSEQHPWFMESAKPERNAYSDRYIWTDNWLESPGEFRCLSGRYDRDGSYIVNFFATQPALNYGFLQGTKEWQLPVNHPSCLATAEAMKDVMRFWLDHGCDGFRVDMADSLVKLDDEKKSATGRIWKGVRAMLDADYPEAALVSEWSNPELSLAYGFHADFLLDHENGGYQELFRKRDNKTGTPRSFFSKTGDGDITVFTEQFGTWYANTRDKGYMSLITCNHDTPRVTRDYDVGEIKLAYAFLFTMPGVPFLYYGDEIGMRYQEGMKSKEGGYSRTGTRTPMQWNSGKNCGFSTADPEKLYLPVDKAPDAPTVEGEEQDAGSVLNTVRSLIAFRRANPDLQADGPYEALYAKKGEHVFAYRRGAFTVAVNPSCESVSVPVTVSGKQVYSIGGSALAQSGRLELAPQTFSVWQG